METLRLKIVLGYDGSGFRGFAEQPGQRTIAGVLRHALETLCQTELELFCAGRTDAGVHARGQVVHVDVPATLAERLGSGQIERSLRKLMEPEVSIRSISIVADSFHARFSAVRRTYRYEVFQAEVPIPYLRYSHWWVSERLDLTTMNLAAQGCVGEHDFSSFCRRPKQQEPVSLVRRVESAHWEMSARDEGNRYRFEIVGNAFCHQMVRSLVGYFVAVGLGKRTSEDFRLALEARDRSYGVSLAPPQGLALWDVEYGVQDDSPVLLASL